MDILVKRKNRSIRNKILIPLDSDTVIGLLIRETKKCPYCERKVLVEVDGDEVHLAKVKK